ncbi:MarR family winged helix-turn-helix transcriptional regulator [Solirubrobacter soli]|uniref:MarR family winged helix-turn-helix transcriptional regulator n=1 Tax=Solirubrobacter soli TaxID=363832 RepID=UPI00040F3D7B|nr:MarR family transcriptional regulator [Solirubrobacter soli]
MSFPRGITDRPALLLVKIGNQIVDRAEDALAGMGLSGRQYMLLAVLSSDDPPSQLELAGLCGLLPAQVVPVLDKLEERGLVERKRSETDRRRYVVTLTDAGRVALEEADALGRRLVDELDATSAEVVVQSLSRSYNTAP